ILTASTEQDLVIFDEIGFLVGVSEELTMEDSQIVPLRQDPEDEYMFGVALDLLPGKQYFYSLYTKQGGSIKIYDPLSFVTHQHNVWAKRASYTQGDNTKGFHHFMAGTQFYRWAEANSGTSYLQKYNPMMDRWTTKSTIIPSEVAHAEFVNATSIGENKALFMTFDSSKKVNYMYLYDAQTDRWASTNTVTDTLYFESVLENNLCSDYDHAYLTGFGRTRNEPYRFPWGNKVYSFNLESETWEQIAEHQSLEMYYPLSIEVHGYIYLINRSIRKNIHRIDPHFKYMVENFTEIPAEGNYVRGITGWKHGIVTSLDGVVHYYNIEKNDWTILGGYDYKNISTIFSSNGSLFLYDKKQNVYLEYIE
ncbi:MAG: hypothetical protein WA960_23355, partial [Tunicatimonas sp.]